jgi:hypothetical protein
MKLQPCFAGLFAGFLVPFSRRAVQVLVFDSYAHEAPYLIIGNWL